MQKKQVEELFAIRRALIKIRSLSLRPSSADAAATLREIYTLADAFHEVPGILGRGEDVDPKIFRHMAALAQVSVSPDYPFTENVELAQPQDSSV
ncbi:hypothetical protein [Paraburkholderia sp. SIMBA_054]|uniref:hypothetical protein n=1 Tax=Paraburkholderia sp. SIMBA_054 TaxID=3085795 RepID=UPI00397DAEA5